MELRVIAPNRLEDLAFEISYYSVIETLLTCNEHRVGRARLLNNSPSSIDVNDSSQQVLQLVSDRIDQHLIGIMNEKTREKYVKKFYKSFHWIYGNEHMPDIWALLDCIMDESFIELETHIAFPDTEPNLKLIPTIAVQSPLLEKLKLNFKLMNRGTEMEILKPVILSLVYLEHLTHLSLQDVSDFHKSSLCYLGASCPSLTHLSITGLKVTNGMVRDIILGEQCCSVTIPEKAFGRLIVPSECLPPFCFTLKELQLGEKGCFIELCDSVAAFALRHLPVLKKMDESVPVCGAIKILHDSSRDEDDWTIDQLDFERKLLLEPKEKNMDPPTPTYSGSLALTTLDFVSVFYGELLNIVGSMCPFLKDVLFCDQNSWKVPYSHLDWYRKYERSVSSPEQIESVFLGWPKLESITLLEVSSEYMKAILKAFGSGLQHLTLDSCRQINVADLLTYCTELESLNILGDSSMKPKMMESTECFLDEAVTFLPNLKNLKSEICLGDWSYLFEEKSTSLVRLTLSCCHIGIKANSEVQDWCRIPKLWPKLEFLDIHQCAGLTMTMISDLVPQFLHLKKIFLPDRILSDEPKVYFSKFMEELSNQVPPVKIFFQINFDNSVCPLVNPLLSYKNKCNYNKHSSGWN